MSFDKVFEDILELLSEDSDQQFIFLTGAAGTGKTTLLERVKNQLSMKKMVVAPTGIAALNIGEDRGWSSLLVVPIGLLILSAAALLLKGAIKKAKDSNLDAADLSEISEGSDQ